MLVCSPKNLDKISSTKEDCYSFRNNNGSSFSIPSPVVGPRKGPLSRALRLVAYNNTATHLNPSLEYYELKDN